MQDVTAEIASIGNMADEKPIKVGTRVEVVGKGVTGKVAYIGSTLFSSGKWIGVICDGAKGKNNGTVQGKTYFTCEDNHGIFVRQSQIVSIDDDTSKSPAPEPHQTPAKPASTGIPKSARKSGLRPPSYAGKSTENLAEATPKRAPSVPSDLSSVGQTPGLSKDKPGSMTRLPQRGHGGSKETLSAVEKPSELPKMGMYRSPAMYKQMTKESKRLSLSSEKVVMDTSRMAMSMEGAIPDTKRPSITPDDTKRMSMSMSAEGSLTNIQQLQEMEGLKAEIKDLNEKLETLKIKRGDDKTKLKEFEKVKIQLQQLQEYKVKAQELHKETQQHLQAAKKDAKDVQESFDAYKDEMTDLSETVEIATLDKEMAEEKSEGLQQEVENLKEKVEELTVDLEILRSEISEKGTDGVASDYQVKQLEQQNERLRDALVKMRDLSNQEKNDAARKTKLNEDMLKELTTLKKDKEKLQTEVASLQAEMIDLKDQVDAALGAEEMVETLTERNLKLEDKIQSLEEEMADLEALHEMNEELQENARESELELREDMDLANGKVAEYKRKLDATSETIADYESTISKFRELVTSLKESIRELQSKQAEAGQKEATPTIETFDFKAKFAETKAYAKEHETISKTIDMELRKLEVAQANKHIAMLQSFMPEFFVNRGGDHDAVLVLLMIPRIIGKAEMLSSQVKEKFELTEGINRETVLKSHKAEQSSFGNNVILMLSTLQAILRQYESALNTCSTDLLLKIGTLLPEMNAHEKSMDYFVELLRKDTLDETVSLDLLEKSIAYFQQLYTVHLSSEKVDCTSMMADKIRMTTNACDCISTDIARLRVLLQAGQEQTEISILMRDLETCCNDSRTCARKIKRRLPQKTGPATPLNFGKEIQTLLSEAGKNITHVVRSLQYTAAGAMQQAALLTGGRMDIENIKKDTEGLLPKKIEEIAYQATDKVYGKEDNGPYDTLRKSFGMVAGAMNKLANAMENGEYDFDGTHEKMPLAPVKVRADMLRTQIADIELMKHRMATKDEEIIELKKTSYEGIFDKHDIKELTQEELSSQQVRLGLLEKKVENATRDSDDRTDQMQRKWTISWHSSRKRKSLLEGISRQASATSPLSPMGGMPTAIHESPVLQQQIVTLKEALKFTKNENIRLQADQMKEKMAKLPPLRVPKRAPWMNRHKEPDKPREIPDGFPGAADLKNLVKQTVELQNEVNNLCSHPRVVDITKRKPGLEPASQSVDPIKELIARTTLLTLLEKKMQELQANITTVQAANRPGGQVRADFSTFPTPQFAKMLHEKSGDSMLVAKICIPVKGQLICPYTILLEYIQIRKELSPTNQTDPLFITIDKKPLERQYFITCIKKVLDICGFNSSHYNGHSFRIGAATSAGKAKIEDHLIKTLGRWTSDSYTRYIRVTPASIKTAQNIKAKMKFNKMVSSSRRKNRKRHFNAPSHVRRKIMSSALSKDLRQKYNVRSVPIEKMTRFRERISKTKNMTEIRRIVRGEMDKVVRGHYKGQQVGKVVQVYRKKFVIYIERIQREKANGASVHVGIDPSKVVIVKLKIDKDRKRILERKARSRQVADKGKHTEETIMETS
ncbi:DCTN1 [Mytilus edulis]|uniref:Dynactin subunit 1 n=1 Tax=Mytilus edulis TaxID=6550 RepID=A0A8S3PSU1_MYTED|nr:DCTN1 [Mytilus edulis]